MEMTSCIDCGATIVDNGVAWCPQCWRRHHPQAAPRIPDGENPFGGFDWHYGPGFTLDSQEMQDIGNYLPLWARSCSHPGCMHCKHMRALIKQTSDYEDRVYKKFMDKRNQGESTTNVDKEIKKEKSMNDIMKEVMEDITGQDQPT